MIADRHLLSRSEWVPAALLVSSYLFGTVMIGHEIIAGFELLTPLHLLFTTALIAWTHRPKPLGKWWMWAAACYLVGYAAEYIGVHEGWLFGQYAYSEVLGPRLKEIPLIIGVNWIVVVYAVCATLNELLPQLHRALKVVLASVLLVALDALIEPVAIRLEFWSWAAGEPPLQNYVGWLLVGLLQAGLFYALIPYAANRLAPLLLILQLVFFGYLTFVL